MKRIWMIGAALAMVSGVAGAQSGASAQGDMSANTICLPPIFTSGCGGGGGTTTSGDSVSIVTGGGSSSLTANISVSIPSIVAMHLHEKSWSLNLGDEKAVRDNCYKAGEHNTRTGRDDLDNITDLMTRSKWSGDGTPENRDNKYWTQGEFTWAGQGAAPRYPGIEYATATGNKVSWKGPIVCFNRKVVEKFSNGAGGWAVNISANNVTDGFPTLILADRVADTSTKFISTLYNAKDKAKAPLTFKNTDVPGMGRTTGGWLDDHILEALVFDGNETAGSKTADVVFQLTGKF